MTITFRESVEKERKLKVQIGNDLLGKPVVRDATDEDLARIFAQRPELWLRMRSLVNAEAEAEAKP